MNNIPSLRLRAGRTISQGVLDLSQPPRRPAYGAMQDERTASDPRNGVGAATGVMSRAEQFEDEKRRFIESCFSKKDNDGSSALFNHYTKRGSGR